MATMFCDSTIRRWVIDPTSGKLDDGHSTQTLSPHLFHALVVRDRHCRCPNCDRPPHWCEGHHVHDYDNGGHAKPENLVLMCRKHHDLVQGR
jgi:hypothetical protein